MYVPQCVERRAQAGPRNAGQQAGLADLVAASISRSGDGCAARRQAAGLLSGPRSPRARRLRGRVRLGRPTVLRTRQEASFGKETLRRHVRGAPILGRDVCASIQPYISMDMSTTRNSAARCIFKDGRLRRGCTRRFIGGTSWCARSCPAPWTLYVRLPHSPRTFLA